MTEGISTEELREAISRIARTPEGEMLYLWLQKRLMALPVVGCNGDDLQKFEGGRMLAGELFAIMSEGINLSGRTDTVRPIVFRTGGSVADARARPSLRRVTADTPVAGFDAPGDAADRHPSQPDPGFAPRRTER